MVEIIKDDLWPNPLKYFNNVIFSSHVCLFVFLNAYQQIPSFII